MYCKTVNECFQEINAYCTGKPWGHPLLVNLENFNDFQTVLQRLEADTSKQCIFVSQFTQKNGLPIIDDAIAKITGKEIYVMVGASQAAMLRNETAVDALVDELLGLSICSQRDPDNWKAIILNDEVSANSIMKRATKHYTVKINTR